MLDVWLKFLQDTAVATAIREGDGLFPWIEAMHVLALTLVIGSISIVDFRLLGWASRDRSLSQTMRAALPVTWCAFLAAIISGTLLFSSNATTYGHNVFFRAKMLLIVLAGINMLAFHFLVGRDSDGWLTPAATPFRGRIVGAVSFGLWVAVVACGRWIGFTLDAMP